MKLDKKKIMIGILVGVPILLGVYLVYKAFFLPKSGNNKTDAPPSDVVNEKLVSTPNTANAKNYFPLSKGSINDKVKTLQIILNSAGANPQLVVDGNFGAKTLAALKSIANLSSINSQSDLDNLKNQIIASSPSSNQELTNIDVANGLVSDYTIGDINNSTVEIYNDILLTQLRPTPLLGQYNTTTTTLPIARGSYPMTQYAYRAGFADGSIRIEVIDKFTGTSLGMYSTDPKLINQDNFGFSY
jgi:peptidoglycan hydrolase-like protein with peptidoglycan-binding domain